MLRKMRNTLVIRHQMMLPKNYYQMMFKNDQAFYPSEDTIENLEVYDNLGQKWLGIYNDLYLQFKMYRK